MRIVVRQHALAKCGKSPKGALLAKYKQQHRRHKVERLAIAHRRVIKSVGTENATKRRACGLAGAEQRVGRECARQIGVDLLRVGKRERTRASG
eukprot:scaffold301614_cov28-Tisochrysis_lutea.AAC.4